MTPFRCHTCGQVHDELPDIGADYPDHWFDIPEAERERRVLWNSDTCVVDGEAFYIRGVIDIPVHGQAEPFGWGVWVSQKKENFETYLANYESATIGPFFGWLGTRIAQYLPDDTTHLKTMAHFRGGGLRPLIKVQPTEHPLAVHQRDGVTLEQAWEFVHFAELPADERSRRIAARRPVRQAKGKSGWRK
jgi:hypothetical protein